MNSQLNPILRVLTNDIRNFMILYHFIMVLWVENIYGNEKWNWFSWYAIFCRKKSINTSKSECVVSIFFDFLFVMSRILYCQQLEKTFYRIEIFKQTQMFNSINDIYNIFRYSSERNFILYSLKETIFSKMLFG